MTFRTFADVFFVTFADKDGSIDMCSLQQNGQSAGRVVVVEEKTVKKIPKKCDGKRIRFEHTFGYCNMCGSIIIFCLKGHVGSLES